MSRDAEARVAEFLAEYEPAIAAELRAARAMLRTRFPRGYELVFDNYNALVFGISPSERASESFISVAGYPKWVTLFFLHGASLSDPLGLLEGAGKQVRGIRLASASVIGTPQVQALIAQAERPVVARLSDGPSLTTVIKTVAASRRSRRPAAKASSPGRARGTTEEAPRSLEAAQSTASSTKPRPRP